MSSTGREKKDGTKTERRKDDFYATPLEATYSCYKVHRDKVTEEVLDKYKVSLEDFTSIICDLWDAGVDTDCY